MRWLLGEKLFQSMAHWVEELLGLSPDFLARLIDTALVVLVTILLRQIVRRAWLRRIADASRRYVVSKALSYVLGILGLLLVVKIWIQPDTSLATYLGILSAGLAIALQDPIVNLAGWLFLVVRQPFRVGDRIQIGEHAGDVVDVRLFMFSMVEIGNWVEADQSTGRIIHVPNGRVFKEPLANYTQGFRYIWHELPVTVTFESDWKKALGLLEVIIQHESIQVDAQAALELKASSEKFNIYFTHLKPIVWVSVADIGVTLTLRYLCDPRKRRSTSDAMWRQILDAFAGEPSIDFAYPTQRFYDNRTEGKPGAGGPGEKTKG